MSKAHEYYLDLAIRTQNWMVALGAIHNNEKHTRHTITVDDWAKNFDIELNEEGNPTSTSHKEWQYVKLAMIEQGMAIAVSPGGHYIGGPGEQATNIIYNIIHGLARVGRALAQLEAVKSSGRNHYITARTHMRGKINPDKIIGLIEASKGVSTYPDYQFSASDDLLLLVAEIEEKEKDKL